MLIPLHRENDSEVILINTNAIVVVEPNREGSTVVISEDQWYVVNETPFQISELITD